jgi:PmbA protein
VAQRPGPQALDFAKACVARARRDGADEAQVEYVQTRRFELDADTNDINLIRTTDDEITSITVFRDGRKGTGTLNGHDPAALDQAVRSAVAAAESGISDEANQVAKTRCHVPQSHGRSDANHDEMIATLREYLGAIRNRYPAILTRHAVYAFNDSTRSFANTAELMQQERRASYMFGTMFGAKEGERSASFNYTGVAAYQPFEHLLAVGSVKRLMEETLRSFDARPVPEKFVGDIIVTPDCVSSLVGSVATALSGYALLAETTPFLGRSGEQIAHAGLSLLNQPRSEHFPGGADFDGAGVSTQDIALIEDGVLREFLVDFYVSKKLGIAQTGGRQNLLIPSGDTTVADIVASTPRGIVLSRFSGGQPNNNLDFSGVAKNSFYVEDGRIRFPLVETMVSGNLQTLLLDIKAISRESINFGGHQYPFLAAGGVTISGK